MLKLTYFQDAKNFTIRVDSVSEELLAKTLEGPVRVSEGGLSIVVRQPRTLTPSDLVSPEWANHSDEDKEALSQQAFDRQVSEYVLFPDGLERSNVSLKVNGHEQPFDEDAPPAESLTIIVDEAHREKMSGYEIKLLRYPQGLGDALVSRFDSVLAKLNEQFA